MDDDTTRDNDTTRDGGPGGIGPGEIRSGGIGSGFDVVEVMPLRRNDLTLAGFLLGGRWPANTREWAQFLALAVRLAAVPGLLPTSTVFRAQDELVPVPRPGTVGVVTSAGPVIGAHSPKPGQFAHPQPPVILMLHPPGESIPSTPEAQGAASGCLLLPGLPYLGLPHRAAWVEAEADGTVTRLVSLAEVDPMCDPDLAVLATLLAA